MYQRLLIVVFIVLFSTGCSKKMVVTTYSDVNIPLAYLKNVNTTIEGSSLFIEQINTFLPFEFNDIEILQDDPNSQFILHIIENDIETFSQIHETQEEKTIQYVDYIFDPKEKKTIPIVKTRDIIYFQQCLVTDYTLSASVTTRFKKDIITATTQNEKCIKRRFNMFHQYELKETNSAYFYEELVDKLKINIKNYLIPYYTTYSVEIDEDIDIEMKNIDEENYENIIEMLADGVYSSDILHQLKKLNNTYPKSFSINYNLGILYEYLGQNKKALLYFQKCLDIKTTKGIIKRIESVKKNITNKEKTQL